MAGASRFRAPVSSPRFQIRHHVVRQLKGRTALADRIFANRPNEPQRAELPCGFVHTRDEPATVFTDSPREYERSLRIWVDIYGETNSGEPADDLVDLIAAEVEREMALAVHGLVQAPPTCGFSINVAKTGLAGTEMDTDHEGAQLEAGCRISWDVVYVTEVDEAELLADRVTPFLTTALTWDLAGSDEDVDASDTLHHDPPL